MKIYSLSRHQVVTRPRDEVFAFFEQPENLARLTPSSVGFRIITPLPIPMHTGTIIDYTIGAFGFRIRWTTLITDYHRPDSFIDVQLKGPYSYWHHTHRFIERDGGTVIADDVRYALPFGPLGRLVHAIAVRRRLDAIFAYRARIIAEIFETGDGEDV